MNTCLHLRLSATEKNWGTMKLSAQRGKIWNKTMLYVIETLHH